MSKDINSRAFSIVQQSTHEPSKADLSAIARALGSKGGKKGGKARAKSLTPERRAEIAKKAAAARWAKKK